MNRRRVLGLVGSAVAGVTAGCSGPAATLARPGSLSCPSMDVDYDRILCAPERGPGGITVASSTWRYEPDSGDETVEPLRFTLRNEGDRTFWVHFLLWQIGRATDRGWKTVTRYSEATGIEIRPGDPDPIRPGKSHTWTFCAHEAIPWDGECSGTSIGLPEAGAYAFRIGGQFIRDPEKYDLPDEGISVLCVAPFEYRPGSE